MVFFVVIRPVDIYLKDVDEKKVMIHSGTVTRIRKQKGLDPDSYTVEKIPYTTQIQDQNRWILVRMVKIHNSDPGIRISLSWSVRPDPDQNPLDPDSRNAGKFLVPVFMGSVVNPN
jgi:hypothetical protein